MLFLTRSPALVQTVVKGATEHAYVVTAPSRLCDSFRQVSWHHRSDFMAARMEVTAVVLSCSTQGQPVV
eukprot:1160301-Pelagomonas_calceolata.AAC.3